MASAKKHHYVPQFYLRNFSSDGNKLYVYDKANKKSFLNSTVNIAHENHFHSLLDNVEVNGKPVLEEDLLIIEKAFARIEGMFNQTIKQLLSHPTTAPIDDKLREELSVWMAIQLLRTRTYRDKVKAIAEDFYRTVLEQKLVEAYGEEALKYFPKIEYKDEAAGLQQMKQVFDFDKQKVIANILYNHVWTLGLNNSSQPFFTSDNPVVIHSHIKGLPIVGIDSPGVEIAYPVSSKLILILGDRSIFGEAKKLTDGMAETLDNSNIEFYNSLQVIHSDRQIYCETSQFDLAEDMCKER